MDVEDQFVKDASDTMMQPVRVYLHEMLYNIYIRI